MKDSPEQGARELKRENVFVFSENKENDQAGIIARTFSSYRNRYKEKIEHNKAEVLKNDLEAEFSGKLIVPIRDRQFLQSRPVYKPIKFKLGREISWFLKGGERKEDLKRIVGYLESSRATLEFRKKVELTDNGESWLRKSFPEENYYIEIEKDYRTNPETGNYEGVNFADVYKKREVLLSGSEIKIIERWMGEGFDSQVIISLLEDFSELGFDWWKADGLKGVSIDDLDYLVREFLNDRDSFEFVKWLGTLGVLQDGQRGAITFSHLEKVLGLYHDLKEDNLFDQLDLDGEIGLKIKRLKMAQSFSGHPSIPKVREIKAIVDTVKNEKEYQFALSILENAVTRYDFFMVVEEIQKLKKEEPEEFKMLMEVSLFDPTAFKNKNIFYEEDRHDLLMSAGDLGGEDVKKIHQELRVVFGGGVGDGDLRKLIELEKKVLPHRENLPLLIGILEDLNLLEGEIFSRKVEKVSRLAEALFIADLPVSEAIHPARVGFFSRAEAVIPGQLDVFSAGAWSLLRQDNLRIEEVGEVDFESAKILLNIFGSIAWPRLSSEDKVYSREVTYFKMLIDSGIKKKLENIIIHVNPQRLPGILSSANSFGYFMDWFKDLSREDFLLDEQFWQECQIFNQRFGDDIVDNLNLFSQIYQDLPGMYETAGVIIDKLGKNDKLSFGYLFSLFKIIKINQTGILNDVELSLSLRDEAGLDIDYINGYSVFKDLKDRNLLEIMGKLKDKETTNLILKEKEFLSSLNDDDRLKAVLLLKKFQETPSVEIVRLRSELLRSLLLDSDPVAAYENVERIFSRNDVPIFVKRFLVFKRLYTKSDLWDEVSGDQSRLKFLTKDFIEGKERVSPVLQEASKGRQLSILFQDILKQSIDSNEQSLRYFLEDLLSNIEVIEKIRVGLIINGGEREVDSTLKRIIAVGVSGELFTKEDLDFSNITTLTQSLAQVLNVKEGQAICDRVVELYASSLGYSSVEEILARMNNVFIEASTRNLEGNYIRDGRLVVGAGDLIKVVNSNDWNSINNQGLIAREFLGGGADSDSTPLDIDLFRLKEGDEVADFRQILEKYGDMYIVIRDRGQFVETRKVVDGQVAQLEKSGLKNIIRNRDQRQKNKYEIFVTGVHDQERHVGVRSGIASTEIDAIVLSKSLYDETEKVALKKESIYFDIASNGFYIPVCGLDNQVVFTVNDYERYNLDQDSLIEVMGKGFSAQSLIDFLRQNPYLRLLYEKSVGVSEGYSLEEHTLMVMGQFEKYFSEQFEGDSFVSLDEMRLLLVLHDIGKPAANIIEGSTSNQHEYSTKIMKSALRALGVPGDRVERLVYLVDQDVIGEYFMGHKNLDLCVKEINHLAEMTNIPPEPLLDIMRIFYISDAGSYTDDAGGGGNLNHLFSFGNKTIDFSDRYRVLYDQLLNAIS